MSPVIINSSLVRPGFQAERRRPKAQTRPRQNSETAAVGAGEVRKALWQDRPYWSRSRCRRTQQLFCSSSTLRLNKRVRLQIIFRQRRKNNPLDNLNSGNPFWRRMLSTVSLFVLTSSDHQLLILELYIYLFYISCINTMINHSDLSHSVRVTR